MVTSSQIARQSDPCEGMSPHGYLEMPSSWRTPAIVVCRIAVRPIPGAENARGTESLQTLRWRELDSNPRSPVMRHPDLDVRHRRRASAPTALAFNAKCAALKLGALTRLRETTNSVIGAIAVEGSRCAGPVGERYIGARSEQICGVPGQARRVVFRSPIKHMQRHVATGAPSHQFGAGRAIDMDLPSYRREGFRNYPFHRLAPMGAGRRHGHDRQSQRSTGSRGNSG
jgi:hypothetical protein